MRNLLWLAMVISSAVVRGQSPAPVVTAFPSLKIPASSRGLAMGDGGIASSVENQAVSYNIARSAFLQNFHQASVSYMPWLPGISNDTRFIHADYLASLNSISALGFAVSYLNMGTMAMRDDNGATIGVYRSSEYHVGTSYALRLGDNASLGVAMRFLGQNIRAGIVKPVYSLCGDISYYQQVTLGDESRVISWGATVTNLGANINLPSTAGLGLAYTQRDETNNQFTLSLDATRLLRDDWRGVRLSAGAEYGYSEQFFLRGGVSLESELRGNRKFFSLGAGYKGFVFDQSCGLDVHYLVPFGVSTAVSPFQNSYGLTLRLNIGNFQ